MDAELVLTLIEGLSYDSRLKRKLSGSPITLSEQLQALTVDALYLRLWQNTKDGKHNRNKPKSLYRKLMKLDEKKKEELERFTTPEEYEAWRRRKYG